MKGICSHDVICRKISSLWDRSPLTKSLLQHGPCQSCYQASSQRVSLCPNLRQLPLKDVNLLVVQNTKANNSTGLRLWACQQSVPPVSMLLSECV
jgi:hypothetical protein